MCSTSNNTKNSQKFRVKPENQQFREDYGGSCSGYQIQDVRFRGGCSGCRKSLPSEYQSSAEDSQRFCGCGTTTMSRQNYTKPKVLSSPKSCSYPQSGPPRRSYPPLPYSVPPYQPPLSQKSYPCGQNSDPAKKGCCPCSSYSGPALHGSSGIDNPEGRNWDYSESQKEPSLPCKCKCQSCRKFNPSGGCGGQSCGGMYSCAGSGSGRRCFPRNYKRREGPECCGGKNKNGGGCC